MEVSENFFQIIKEIGESWKKCYLETNKKNLI